MASRPRNFQRGGGKQPSRSRVSEFPTRGECPHNRTDPKPTVGGRRAHFALDWTGDASGTDHGGQEF